MKKILCLFIGVMGFISVCSASGAGENFNRITCPEKRPTICTMDYTPVCGLHYDNSMKTYSNACNACSNSNVISHVPKACPERTLSAAEVTQLFSGNTYVALIPSRNLKMTVYVDPNGTMTGMQNGHKFSSKWKISDKGEICVSYRDKMSCRLVLEQHGVYKKVKVNEQGETIVLVIYESFSKGNVHNY